MCLKGKSRRKSEDKYISVTQITFLNSISAHKSKWLLNTEKPDFMFL